MKKKANFKTQSDTRYIQTRIQKSTSLSELSISQIQQLKTTHDSIDFQQQRDLITDFITKVDQSKNQYGLHPFSKKIGIKGQTKKEASRFKRNSKIIQNSGLSSNSKHKKHEQLFFNHQKKRKFSSKAKISKRFLNTDQAHCLQNSSGSEKTFPKNKSNQTSIMSLCPIIPPLSNFFRKKSTIPVFEQKPLISKINTNGQKSFLKLYHLREDQFKQQLQDLNVNLNLNQAYEERNKSISIQPKTHNRLTNNLKNSLHQEIKFHQNINANINNSQDRKIAVANCYYRQGIMQNLIVEKPKIFELKRPISLDNNNVHSIFSLSTITKQSPFSRDSSTGTQKTVKKPPPFSIGSRNKIESSFRKQTKNIQTSHWGHSVNI